MVILPSPDALMKAVVDRYLKSGDFNGLHLHTNVEPALIDAATQLVQDGMLQVMVSALITQTRTSVHGLRGERSSH